MLKSQIKATAKYNAKSYDELKIRVKKGEKEIIQNKANMLGLSLNGYINSLIEKDMKGE